MGAPEGRFDAQRQSSPGTGERAARREVSEARHSLRRVRVYYVVNAGVFGVLALLSMKSTLFDLGAGTGFLLMCVGVLGLDSQPFLWSLGIASLWAVFVASLWFLGWSLLGIRFLFGTAWTVGSWAVLPTTARIGELRTLHPGLWQPAPELAERAARREGS